ncbi:MAG: redoxin domain-containing protein [Cellvibrionaceae bacterium]
MLSGKNRHFAPLLYLLFLCNLGAANAAERIGNFVLLDQYGKAHELHYNTDAKAIILLGHSTRTDNSSELVAALSQIKGEFAAANVKVFLLNADPKDSRKTVVRQTETLDHDFPVLMDEGQLVAESLAISHVGEVLVINPKNWQVLYRGPIAGNTKEGKDDYLRDAIAKHLNEQAIQLAERPMPANTPALAQLSAKQIQTRENISYSETIAPLLMEKCVDCHRPEGIGPWAMTSHTMIKGFAPMIKEVVLTRRMPPWHADPQINHFKEDIGLSVAEKQTLIHWIDAGAPRGSGDDPLTQVGVPESQWVLGKPDLVLELPAYDIPATGVIDYQFFEVSNTYPEDAWVKAVQIIPGDRQTLHHAIATFGEPVDPSTPVRPVGQGGEGNSILQEQLMTFVPGNEHYIYPEETGLLLPTGSSLFFQMHYTTSGKATTDKSKIGIYFRDDAPEHMLRHYVIANTEISIPPQEGAHQEAAYVQFHEPVIIYSLFPHAHYRGRSSEFAVRYPDGREETVLSVPNYDFNWQRYFRLEEPLEVPAGSKLIHRTTYDNSPLKDSNPDPTQTVPWGLQSWDEMLYGGVSYRFKEPKDAAEMDVLQFRTDIMMGMLDRNMDGKLVAEEMTGDTGEQLVKMAVWFDSNKSGGLEHEELKNLFVTLREEARKRRAQQSEQASN